MLTLYFDTEKRFDKNEVARSNAWFVYEKLVTPIESELSEYFVIDKELLITYMVNNLTLDKNPEVDPGFMLPPQNKKK